MTPAMASADEHGKAIVTLRPGSHYDIEAVVTCPIPRRPARSLSEWMRTINPRPGGAGAEPSHRQLHAIQEAAQLTRLAAAPQSEYKRHSRSHNQYDASGQQLELE